MNIYDFLFFNFTNIFVSDWKEYSNFRMTRVKDLGNHKEAHNKR